ncbi:MAG: hypothetical protein GX366_03030 [Epulopiscium sp.]|nr:hypothetical protein [Candidatus Epulonipiscium sp.]
MDHGYDANQMFLTLDKLKQDYVIRLTKKQSYFFIINGSQLPNFVIVERARLNPCFSTKERTMWLTFHM